MNSIRHVLCDIDGTLTDSAPGIIRAYTVVAEKLKVPAPPPEKLRDFIGTSLRGNFATYVPHDKIELAVKHYHHCYDHMRIGLIENSIHDGTLDMLEAILSSGKKLYIVTAKLKDFTLPILNLFGLEPYFKSVYAPEYAEPVEMVDMIARAMKAEGLDPKETIMVGDRHKDLEGANANGIGFVGVSWGYGGRKELEKAGAKYIVDTQSELVSLLG